MTVSSSINKVSYVGNGIVKEFAVPFKFFENADLEVYFKTENIAQKKLVENDDYTVVGAGNENGGTVTLTDVPQTGDKVVILRVVPMTQEIDYQENEIFPAETQEMALDKLTMEIQQLNEKTSRAVIVPVTGDGTPEEIVEEVLQAQSDTYELAAEAEASAQSAQTALSGALAAQAAAESAVDGFDDHVAEKQSGFDAHVTEQTTAFDTHAAEKQAAVDASASAAAGSTSAAATSAATAEQWAVGQPTEPAEFSAKAWAGQSQTNAVNGLAAINARIADFEANGEAVISTDMRYFNVVTASEYAALPAEKKTSAYFYIVIPG